MRIILQIYYQALECFLRVTYRKSDEQIKEKINEWISELELKNFYNNYYLEDIMLSIKSI